MQQHNMVIPNQAGTSVPGVCRDLTDGDLQYGDQGKVQALSKDWEEPVVNDETAFRFVFRCDLQPWWTNALTPFKGSNTVSPFVVLT